MNKITKILLIPIFISSFSSPSYARSTSTLSNLLNTVATFLRKKPAKTPPPPSVPQKTKPTQSISAPTPTAKAESTPNKPATKKKIIAGSAITAAVGIAYSKKEVVIKLIDFLNLAKKKAIHYETFKDNLDHLNINPVPTQSESFNFPTSNKCNTANLRYFLDEKTQEEKPEDLVLIRNSIQMLKKIKSMEENIDNLKEEYGDLNLIYLKGNSLGNLLTPLLWLGPNYDQDLLDKTLKTIEEKIQKRECDDSCEDLYYMTQTFLGDIEERQRTLFSKGLLSRPCGVFIAPIKKFEEEAFSITTPQTP